LRSSGDPFAGIHHVAAALEVGDESSLERALAPRTGPRVGAGYSLVRFVADKGNHLGVVCDDCALIGAEERRILDTVDASSARPADQKTGIDGGSALGTGPVLGSGYLCGWR
jgi:hypothetical protein